MWPVAHHSRQVFAAEGCDAPHTGLPGLLVPAELLLCLTPGRKPWLRCQTIWAAFRSSLQFSNTRLLSRGSWRRCLLYQASKGCCRKAVSGTFLVSTCIAEGEEHLGSNPHLAIPLRLINLLSTFWAVGTSSHFPCVPRARDRSLLRPLLTIAMHSTRRN